jgi:hypothetical protein
VKIVQDEIWNNIKDIDSFENFQKSLLQPVYLKDEVPDEIKSQATTVEKLLLHSYYEHRFVDVALTQAVFILEKALRLKWKEINKRATTKNLKELIDWFYKNGYFETRNQEVPHQLRQVKNSYAEEETKSFSDLAFLQKVYNAFDLINDLYESPLLRVSRIKEIDDLNRKFSSFMNEGAILFSDNQQSVVFQAYPIFINNRQNQKTLTLLVCPVFDLKPFELGEHFVPPYLVFTLTEWQINDSMLMAKDIHSDKPVLLVKISDELRKNTFQGWHEKLFRLNNWTSLLMNICEIADQYFIENLRLFHRSKKTETGNYIRG